MRALVLPLALAVWAETSVREVIYSGAVSAGGQIVPRFDKGWLAYVYHPNRLELFRPDGQRALDTEVQCPGSGFCSTAGIAVGSRGTIAVTLAYIDAKGRGSGIRLLSPEGRELRFIDTFPYVPVSLAFDEEDDLWSLGWQRGEDREYEDRSDYPIVRKFSRDGKATGAYLRKSLWPNPKANPGYAGRGYWHMNAAAGRIGAIVHEDDGDNVAEWIVWNLNGNVLSRTPLSDRLSLGRAFTADGRLYARFARQKGQTPELRVLDTATAKWTAAADNLPERERSAAFLLGADGNDLVYRVGHGMVRLLRVPPRAR